MINRLEQRDLTYKFKLNNYKKKGKQKCFQD